ncbi:MAG: antiterminator LoaP [Clostridiales bacterium]|nr:antiterminator LoaP [Eubacteriales bacterium]MDH7567785.1 antiterminator LoaP [Clostridiales bacterium]
MRGNDWYALFVITGEEDNVKERLKYRFEDRFRILVPKRRLRERKNGMWHDIIRVLFPGYVLINGTMDNEEYYRLKGVPGLLKLLRAGYDPLRVEYHEMEIINQLICNDETIGFSDVLVENGRVVVVDGPLVSMEGLIAGIDRRKGRAKVILNFMGEPRTVELGISVLQPA